MAGLWVVLVALYGACAGSYLGVVLDRLPQGRALARGSSCGACGRPVQARDNVPVVSYLVLRGRCRSCGTGISAWWWLLEVVMAALWVVGAVLAGPGVLLAALLALSWLGVLAAALATSPVRSGAGAVRPTAWTAAALPVLALALQVAALGAAAQSRWGAAAALSGAGAALLLVSVPLAPPPDPSVAALAQRAESAHPASSSGRAR